MADLVAHTPPAYQPLFDRLLHYAIAPEFQGELAQARAHYFSLTGEAFDEDRTFHQRMQSFLDWYVFDRPLGGTCEPPSRAFLLAHPELSDEERQRFRLLSRTVHGLFALERVRAHELLLLNLPTGAEYRMPLPVALPGVRRGDLFEARLVPFEGRYHFSAAFLFHPPHVRPRVVRELRRQRREEPAAGVQEIIFTLSRMAGRAEHYRNVTIDAMYDFARPPPVVAAERMRFDPESVARRLGRLPALPSNAPPSDEQGA